MKQRLFSRHSALALALLATISSAGTAHAAKPSNAERVATFSYIQGRLALADANPEVAGGFFADAMKARSSDSLLRRALEAAVLAGDTKQADTLARKFPLVAPDGEEVPGQSLILLTRAAIAAGRGDWNAYNEVVQSFPGPAENARPQILEPVLLAYGLAAHGYTEEALARIETQDEKGKLRPYFLEHRAAILGFAKRWQEAADIYTRLAEGPGQGVPRIRLAAAATLMEASPDNYAQAIKLLAAGNDAPIVEARRKLEKNPKISGLKLGGILTSPAEGIGLFLLQMSVDLSREHGVDSAVTFARLATFAAPGLSEAWLATADFMARSERPELGLKALDHIKANSNWHDVAQTRRAVILAGAKRYAEARKVLGAQLKKRQPRVSDYVLLGDIERRADDKAAAAEALSKALAVAEARDEPLPPAQTAQLHFLRGAAYERSGQWEKAEADLREAVNLQGSNPVYLNYLGYSLIDRNAGLGEATELISRAYAAAPDSGAIIDSMGWAVYLNQDYPRAVELLEQAHIAEPADPTVADHLGDALWRSGRHFEARHAWNAALAFTTDDDLRQKLTTKLDYGLDFATPAK